MFKTLERLKKDLDSLVVKMEGQDEQLDDILKFDEMLFEQNNALLNKLKAK